MKRCLVTLQPAGRQIFVPAGSTIKEAIGIARLNFDFPCGGKGKCGKCRVRVPSGVAEPSALDRKHLEPEELERGVRLACATRVEQDLVVELPNQQIEEHKILLTTTERDVQLAPHIQKYYLDLPKPELTDQRPDWERLKDSLVKQDSYLKDCTISLELLRRLPHLIRDSKFQVTAIISGRELVGMETGHTSGRILGIAFDIGTTTIVGYLLDLVTGKELGVASALNPQTQEGADVISRITLVTQQPDALQRLNQLVTGMLNQLICEVTEKAGVECCDIYAVTVVGNTCMHHLFLGIDPTNIALSPYVPVTGEPVIIAARELGLQINEAGRIFVLPNIAGFVGADTVGVILATEMDWSQEIKLAIDIGTNGEIVLGNRERLVSCSAAAGPAFEGAQLSCGMRGATGAIDHVFFGEQITYTTIGSGKPRGICGSGLIDLVAGLLAAGVIEKSGRMVKSYQDRIIEQEGMTAFVLVPETETEHGRPILLTQKDIRELQLAKGAMATGIAVLIEEFGITVEQISEVLLAGAFGNYMDPRSACAIGLIPLELADKVKMVGNAAGTGSMAALLSRGEYQRAALIADFVNYVELGAYPKFTDLFARSLSFPEVDRVKSVLVRD